jgi:uncharacterized protein YjiS (DUF1127 family)
MSSTITAQRPWPGTPAQETATSSSSARRHLRTAKARTAASILRWHRVRRDTRQVMALSDTMLKDIGLSRGEIEHAVRTGRARP